MKRPQIARLPTSLALLTALLLSAPGEAKLDLTTNLGEVEGQGWRLEQVSLRIEHDVQSTRSNLTIGRVVLPEQGVVIQKVELSCPGLVINSEVDCERGTVELELAEAVLDSEATSKIAAQIDARIGPLSADGLAWSLTLETDPFAASLFRSMLNSGLRRVVETAEEQLEYLLGELQLQLKARGHGGELGEISATIGFHGFDFGNGMGTKAGEGLIGEIEISLHRPAVQQGYQLSSRLQLLAGALFINPMFLTVAEAPVELAVAWHWDRFAQQARVNYDYSHPHRFRLSGGVSLSRGIIVPTLEEGFLRVEVENLDLVYRHYLQPFLLDTVLSDLNASGALSLRLSYRQQVGVTSLGLTARQVDMVDQQGRFALTGLSANLPWVGDGSDSRGVVSWQGLRLYRIPVGAGESRLLFEPNRLQADFLPIRLFDGALDAGRVVIDNLGSGEISASLQGEITPISLELVSEALEWPALSGSLSGAIPQVRYRDGRVELDGKVMLDVFDGQVEITHLQTRELFGVNPSLSADIAFDDLDLRRLTNTFEFGEISGRLEGYVRDLHIESWRPVAFDAWLQTPATDSSRHQISQRALDSLSSIGGAGAVLQSTLLRFFERFSYRRLGIGCRLQHGVCNMRGIDDRESGFYIVQGGGFWPRIDLIGYNRRVDWQELLRRLAAALDVEAVEIR